MLFAIKHSWQMYYGLLEKEDPCSCCGIVRYNIYLCICTIYVFRYRVTWFSSVNISTTCNIFRALKPYIPIVNAPNTISIVYYVNPSHLLQYTSSIILLTHTVVFSQNNKSIEKELRNNRKTKIKDSAKFPNAHWTAIGVVTCIPNF